MADVLAEAWLTGCCLVIEGQEELALSGMREPAAFFAEYGLRARWNQSARGNGARLVG
jgi:hypothetical protein